MGDNIDMTREKFATRLGQLRVERNLSAYELSLRIGKSHNYVHMVEASKVNISLEVIFALARELNVDPIELFKF